MAGKQGQKSSLGETIRQARASAKMSQSDLAQALGATQGTVSRLERDASVRPHIVRKALEILKDYILPTADRRMLVAAAAANKKAVLRDSSTKMWDLAYFRFSPSGFSGDVVAIAPVGRDATAILLADATGSGPDASAMAVAIEFAFYSLVSAIGPSFLGPEGLRIALESAFHATRGRWQGPPSLTLALLEDHEGFLDLLNAGMPSPFIRTAKKSADYLPLEAASISALGAENSPSVARPYSLATTAGDSFLFYSDGFLEQFEKTAEGTLLSRFSDAAKLLGGDAKGILINLTKDRKNASGEVQDFVDGAQDDMAAIVISRKRESR